MTMSPRQAQICRELAAARPDLGITEVVPLTTGFSNETYEVAGTNLILRLPPAGGVMLDGFDVLGQARIYQALGAMAGGPPVPRIVALFEDTSAPCFLMERIEGEAISERAMPDWFTGASPEGRREICRRWIGAYSGNARLAPLPILGEPCSPESYMRRWQGFAKDAGAAATVAAIDRLLKVPAPLSGPPALIHGDPKVSNLLWQDGQITAMLDWEMALNGEPLSDLGYMLYAFASPFHGDTPPTALPGMLSREEVIAHWSQVTGRSSEGFEWHEIAQFAKLCAILAEGVNLMSTGRSQDPKLAAFQRNYAVWVAATEAMLDAAGL